MSRMKATFLLFLVVTFERRISVFPRVGPGKRKTWIHSIFPVGVKIQPYDFNFNRRYALYINVGAGLGSVRPFDKHWFLHIDLASFFGVRAAAETSWIEEIIPRIRCSGELLVGLGLRL
jgi:hypothetical protein